MRFHRLCWAAAFLAAPLVAQSNIETVLPDSGTTGQGDVAITIYNNNLALVQDRRQLHFPSGRSRQEFPDVSAQIQAQTVSFAAPGTAIVEQNFDYDLLTPNALMQKAVGEDVTLVRINPATGAEVRERARILAANNGVVMRIGDRIEVLRDDGLPIRVIFDKVPPNLRARPTLSVTVDSDRAGSRPVNLTYLTPGLGWSADYVLLFDEKANSADVQGWITLSNNSGTTYHNAEVLMVAGTVGGSGSRRRSQRVDQVGTESGDRDRLGDYYLYPLALRTTVANAQTKQVSFLDVQGTAAERRYLYRVPSLVEGEVEGQATSAIHFSNSRSGGLGDQLPAGTIRVYVRDAKGQPQFIGANQIGHTPMGSRVNVPTGEAFDINIKATMTDQRELREGDWEETARYRINDGNEERVVTIDRKPTYWQQTMRYTISNAGPDPVTVDLVQANLSGWWKDTRVTSETIEGVQRNVDERLWHVPVPANGKTVVTVTYATRR